MFIRKEREYASCGFMDFEALADFAEELSFDELLSVNGGCGGGCGGGGGGSYSPSYSPSRSSSGSGSSSSSGCGGTGTSSSSSSSSGCGGRSSTSSSCGGGNENEFIVSETRPTRAEVKNGWSWLLGSEIPDNPESFVPSDDYGSTENRAELSKEYQVSTFHHGVDIPAPEGTRINAMLPGVVIDVTNSEQLGNSILIQLADNSVIRYSHCDEITVEVGATVLAGDQVATVGMTGITTGPHVHVSYDGDGDGFYGEDYVDNPNRILCPGY